MKSNHEKDILVRLHLEMRVDQSLQSDECVYSDSQQKFLLTYKSSMCLFQY